MSSLSSFNNPAAYHILSYGTLLGATFFQSFIGGIIAFRALPRAQFSTLQRNIFPVYFILQSVTPIVMAMTHPLGPRALLSGSTPNSKLSFWLIGYMFATGLINCVYVGPQTVKIMRERKHQETKDGKKSYDEGPHSEEMQALNKRFGMLHGISSLVNLSGFLSMVWYGALLGEKIQW